MKITTQSDHLCLVIELAQSGGIRRLSLSENF
jgi:hypothetical protein